LHKLDSETVAIASNICDNWYFYEFVSLTVRKINFSFGFQTFHWLIQIPGDAGTICSKKE